MKKGELKTLSIQMAGALFGIVLYVLGTNILIVPLNLYNGGVVGVSQVIRTALSRYAGLNFPFDLAGILSYVINIPLLVLAYLKISKRFFVKSLICITSQSILLSVIPAPSVPLIEDPLTACLVGGIIVGTGVGITLRFGGSGGGTDTLGMYMVKYKPGASVGKVSFIINACIYVACALMFGISVVVYSFIYAAVQSFAVDRAHLQNINTEVVIFTKVMNDDMQKHIMSEMERGVTIMHGEGAYTGEEKKILFVVISKYELPMLKKIVHEFDPSAFIVAKDNIEVSGHFLKHL